MSGYEAALLLIGAAIGSVALIGGFVLADRIREWRWRKWHR